jgi:hypothetical protein
LAGQWKLRSCRFEDRKRDEQLVSPKKSGGCPSVCITGFWSCYLPHQIAATTTTTTLFLLQLLLLLSWLLLLRFCCWWDTDGVLYNNT